jgi:hypothetical protein
MQAVANGLGIGARSSLPAPSWVGAQQPSHRTGIGTGTTGTGTGTPASHPRTRLQLAQSPQCPVPPSSSLDSAILARPCLSRRHRTEPRGSILKRLCAALRCSPRLAPHLPPVPFSLSPPRPRPRTAASLAAHPSATRSNLQCNAPTQRPAQCSVALLARLHPRSSKQDTPTPTPTRLAAHRCTAHRPPLHRLPATLRPLRQLTFLSSQALRPTPAATVQTSPTAPPTSHSPALPPIATTPPP